MAQGQLWKPQSTRRSSGRALAYRGPHLPHAEPKFTHLSRSRHPLTPKSAISPFAADNSPDYLNYYVALLSNRKRRLLPTPDDRRSVRMAIVPLPPGAPVYRRAESSLRHFDAHYSSHRYL